MPVLLESAKDFFVGCFSMVERSFGSSCESCIDRSHMTLSLLARQYVAGDHWMRDEGNRMPGDYSLQAIHAIGRRININRSHLDIRAPFLRDEPDITGDERRLFAIKTEIADGTFNAERVSVLQHIAQRRRSSWDSFLNKGKSHWDEEAEKAKPFLDRMSNRDPAEPIELRERFQRVYWLDQGPFILARTALATCKGLWFEMCPYGDRFQQFRMPVQKRA